MGILKRMTDMTKASLNEMLDKMEDPVVMLNQYLRDMEAEIHEAERTVAKQMAAEQRMKNRYGEAVSKAAERQSQAEQALLAGQEELARKLLEEKVYYEQQADEFSALYEQNKAQAEELRKQLDDMRNELQDLRSKRSELASRADAAKAQKQVAQIGTQHTIESGGASRGFYRMEEKIMQLEAEAEVARMPGFYRQTSAASAAAPIDPAKELQVNEQLEALKRKLNTTNAPGQPEA
ncbi:PspA/IM30 family protein [Paenibacillus abyssi]|uniref:Phage shock protein A n=1 Tax=Paenibacillus abyssi TaxID=1340531 RepID=A0A917G3I6_9BACL|nr:PspA/IM30 family protein [Paenibacillus abyssi]GGG21207.1 phage shock protein A [Paenibacillus abyssi]